MKILFTTISIICAFSFVALSQSNSVTDKSSVNVISEKSLKTTMNVSVEGESAKINTNKSAASTGYSKPQKQKSKFNRKPELVSDKKNIPMNK